MHKNKPWNIAACKPPRGPDNRGTVMEVQSETIIGSIINSMSEPVSIQTIKAGRARCLAIMIPPDRGIKTRIKGAFLNCLSNMDR
ncbi:MAG: hypothetical protein AMS26_13315 [Bacteroides sp. SM23_62]|nr:MAG: hypothetical protein AMS26_13315 [Bacteroides sp. SM23_62]